MVSVTFSYLLIPTLSSPNFSAIHTHCWGLHDPLLKNSFSNTPDIPHHMIASPFLILTSFETQTRTYSSFSPNNVQPPLYLTWIICPTKSSGKAHTLHWSTTGISAWTLCVLRQHRIAQIYHPITELLLSLLCWWHSTVHLIPPSASESAILEYIVAWPFVILNWMTSHHLRHNLHWAHILLRSPVPDFSFECHKVNNSRCCCLQTAVNQNVKFFCRLY